jgi:dipeptidyl aminopeptidase/acylaminoacyl peptidase
MKRTEKWFLAILLLSFVATVARAQAPATPVAKRPISIDDLINMARVQEPQISPDGKWVAYTVQTPDVADNTTLHNIWIVSTAGGDAHQLTHGDSDSLPQWSPDSTRIAFLSQRDGTSAVFVQPAAGGEALKLTALSGDADNVHWSPDGRWISFTSNVFPDCADDDCDRARLAAAAKDPVKAHVYDHLLFRHWTHWSDGRRSHLFVVSVQTGQTRDLTAGADYDVPPDERGDPGDIAWSPDSKELCYTAVTDRPEATSTNGDLFTVPATGGASKRITTNPGFDGHPTYSPDGRFIAYHSQATPEYESDLFRLMLYNRATGTSVQLAKSLDLWVDTIIWAPDSKNIYFHAQKEFWQPVFEVAAEEGAEAKAVINEGFNDNLSISADGSLFAFLRSSGTMPTDVYIAHSDGTGVKQLTHQNAERLAQLDLPKPEFFWFTGGKGERVQAMLTRPPGFDPTKKYPLLLLAHGGPQTAWEDAWGASQYRWNAQVFAAPGYVTLQINRHGSTGYGQAFVDEIQDDWGGAPYEDLMKGVDYVLANYPFVDGTRMGAAGPSYGGYMIDWIATHTNRFKCLVSHAGPYDEASMYGSTEELWFVEHDFKGMPWTNPQDYMKWSPSTYAAKLGEFKTPILLTTGEMDYRVPYTQVLEFFTALQRQGVPSKLAVFPNDGHWLLKPMDSKFWYTTVQDWLANYLK